jgi:hypothetical protein
MVRLLPLAAILAATLAGQTISWDKAPSTRLPRKWTASLQTGLTETFQLTLGGVFGDGPAWQNKVSISYQNVFTNHDSITLHGWMTHDTPSHGNDWLAGINYRALVWRRRGQTLHLTGGVQKWRFPSVLKGANDWLVAGTALYQTKLGKFPVAVNSDAWTILYSPLPGGSLVHTQAYNVQPLAQGDNWSLSLKHGPQHTYSWNFYSTHGHRVVRYAAGLVARRGPHSFEAGYRKQWGLQARIPNNNYWSFCYTRDFSF